MIVRKDSYLQGAVDFLIESGPDVEPRYAGVLELARQAREAGLRAVVLLDPLTQTIHKAYYVNRYLEGIQAFGGVTLNRTAGGYDVRTVEFACRLGARVVRLATHDARGAGPGEPLSFGHAVEPLSLLNEKRSDLLPVAKKIIDVMARNRVVILTGGIDAQEALAVARYCREIGSDRLVVGAVNAALDRYTDDVIARILRSGASLSLSYANLAPGRARQDPRECARLVDKFGPNAIVLESGLGSAEDVSPTEGLRCFCHYLAKCGVPTDYVDIMAKRNPARLLGLG